MLSRPAGTFTNLYPSLHSIGRTKPNKEPRSCSFLLNNFGKPRIGTKFTAVTQQLHPANRETLFSINSAPQPRRDLYFPHPNLGTRNTRRAISQQASSSSRLRVSHETNTIRTPSRKGQWARRALCEPASACLVAAQANLRHTNPLALTDRFFSGGRTGTYMSPPPFHGTHTRGMRAIELVTCSYRTGDCEHIPLTRVFHHNAGNCQFEGNRTVSRLEPVDSKRTSSHFSSSQPRPTASLLSHVSDRYFCTVGLSVAG